VSLESDARLLRIGAVVVAGCVALVALVLLEARHRQPPAAPAAAPAAEGIAPSYAELRGSRRGPNAWMYRSVSRDLAEPLPALDEPVDKTGVDRGAALAARKARRAYDGAPPTIPHEITQRGLDCVGCHAEGAVLDGKVAPRMSHPPYPSCTQCHVPDGARSASEHAPSPPEVESTFEGLASPGRGTRAWPGAPPTIPHATQMRSECTSCHGPAGQLAFRSPHLTQTACTQCHVPSAARDQRPPWVREEKTP
jgi:cytochrome c-type protein NapB